MDAADQDATQKEYCDKEMRETKAKQDDKTNEIEELSTKIDQMSSAVTRLKGEIAEHNKALAKLSRSQAEMDRLRSNENAEYVKVKANLEQGIDGVKKALQVLSEYYGNTEKDHNASEGAG